MCPVIVLSIASCRRFAVLSFVRRRESLTIKHQRCPDEELISRLRGNDLRRRVWKGIQIKMTPLPKVLTGLKILFQHCQPRARTERNLCNLLFLRRIHKNN